MTDLVVRRLLIDLKAEFPRRWVGGDAFLSALFNALSMSFPVGERFFIDAVREGLKALPEAEQLGELGFDVAYGGNFYAIVEPQRNFRDMADFTAGELVANLKSAFADSAGTTVRMVATAAPAAIARATGSLTAPWPSKASHDTPSISRLASLA